MGAVCWPHRALKGAACDVPASRLGYCTPHDPAPVGQVVGCRPAVFSGKDGFQPVTVGLKPDLQDLEMPDTTLLFEKQDGIAWVTLNRGRLGPRTSVRGITGAAQSWR